MTATPPAGTTALDPGNDSATDQDPIEPVGILADGFESPAVPPTVPGAAQSLRRGGNETEVRNFVPRIPVALLR